MDLSMYTILYLFSNILRTYDLHMLYETFFQKKSNRKIIVGFFIFYLIISAEYVFINQPFLTLGLNIVGLFFLALLFQSSIFKSVLCSIFAFALTWISEAIVLILTGVTSNSIGDSIDYSSEIGITIIPIVLLLLCLIFRLIKRNRPEHSLPLSHCVITIIIPLICLVLSIIFFSANGLSEVQFLTIAILLLGLCFGTLWLYDRQMIFYEQAEQQKLILLQNDFFCQEIENMQLLEQSTKRIRHDLKNHLLSINILAQKNEDTEVINYITSILTDLQQNGEYVTSGNVIINGICNYYIAIAKQYDIDVSYNVAFPDTISIDKNDITILLGNIWSNCIENAKDSDNPSIDFQLQYDKNRLLLSAKNTFTGTRTKVNDTYLSTKDNPSHHGIGLKNMEQIIEKYGGHMELKTIDDIFQVQILIYLS